jgi:hypothetical protein
MKAPGDPGFTDWKVGTSHGNAIFLSSRLGKYEFEARVRNVNSGESAGFSQPIVVKVN